MRTPLERVRLGAVVLGVIFAAAVGGYVYFFGRSLLDAVYFVLNIMGTVGLTEHSSLPPGEKAFTITFIVVGIFASLYTVGGFIQMVAEGEILRALGERRMIREIEHLSGHVVICGFGRIGQLLAQELQREGQPFVVVERTAEGIADAHELGYLVLTGDATQEEVLVNAGVERAKALVTALPSDADNVFITLTSRNLSRTLQIIARAEQHTTQKKLTQAGANRVVLPSSIGAQRIFAMITRPSTVELMELVADRTVVDVEMSEFEIPQGSPLVGMSMGRLEANRRLGVLLVAVKGSAGNLHFNPGADYAFQTGDIAIVMGRGGDIERFRKEYHV
jgi:voltage-gated potassium channel